MAEVVTGSSTVNQASITGESLPADKTVRRRSLWRHDQPDRCHGRSRSPKPAATPHWARCKQLILQAETDTNARSCAIADQYAGWYTPVVLMLAGIVWFFTHDAYRAISMLIISCPCAIILSTPTAMVAALSAAARLGLLIKKVTDLEVARKLTAIVFDKTGTLTTGKLSVTRMKPGRRCHRCRGSAADSASDRRTELASSRSPGLWSKSPSQANITAPEAIATLKKSQAVVYGPSTNGAEDPVCRTGDLAGRDAASNLTSVLDISQTEGPQPALRCPWLDNCWAGLVWKIRRAKMPRWPWPSSVNSVCANA
jgi:magnesium-transporting ATPase (P-type)